MSASPKSQACGDACILSLVVKKAEKERYTLDDAMQRIP